MKNIFRDVQMFGEAFKNPGFWRDLRYTTPVAFLWAFLLFKSRDDHALAVFALIVASFVLCFWYTLSNGYVLYTYGIVQRFRVSAVTRPQGWRSVEGFLQGGHRRYSLVSNRALDLKAGDTILVLRHPYRDSVNWITKRAALNYEQLERLRMMQIGSLPMYYEDMPLPK